MDHLICLASCRIFHRLVLPLLIGDLEGNGLYLPVTDESTSVSCGCSTPPIASPTMAPTPAPTDGGGGGGVPLGAVIGGSVGGAAFLAIVGAFAIRCNRAKRNDKSFGASTPGPENYPVVPRGGGDGGASAGKGLPPPPAYGQPSSLHPGDGLPPPPAYSEPPPYDS